MEIDSAKVKSAMIAGCFSVRGLAKTAGLAENTIQKVLNRAGGRYNMRTLGKLAKALDVPASVLIKD